MACDHIGGPELAEMAEEDLRTRGVALANGMRFRWAENLTDGFWTSVIIEVERRNDDWVITRIDRSKERLAETGYSQLD